MTPVERFSHIGTWLYVRGDKLINSLYERMHRQTPVDRHPVARALRLTYLKIEHDVAGLAQEASTVKTAYATSHVPVETNRAIFQIFMSATRDIDGFLLHAEDAVCADISDEVKRRDTRRYARLGAYVYWALLFEQPKYSAELEILGRLRLSHYSHALAELGLHVPGTPEEIPGR